jgi:hypothetical protein
MLTTVQTKIEYLQMKESPSLWLVLVLVPVLVPGLVPVLVPVFSK